MPTTLLGTFLGWRIESSVRHRGNLVVAEYDQVRQKGLNPQFLHSVHQKEVHFPAEVRFPLAEAATRALTGMSDVRDLVVVPPSVKPLPFAEAPREAWQAGARAGPFWMPALQYYHRTPSTLRWYRGMQELRQR